MSNQELQNQSGKKEDEAVNKRRRFIKGAGIAAPVTLTLTSPSVFGALCLSEMMSGNASLTGPGSCVVGFSPGAWKNPVGRIGPDSTLDAWKKTGFEYGKYKSGLKNSCSSYTGGTPFSDSKAFGSGDIRPMREILDKDNGTPNWHLIAALLNAHYLKDYALTPDQVIGLWKGTIKLPPPYTNINDFLDSTWG